MKLVIFMRPVISNVRAVGFIALLGAIFFLALGAGSGTLLAEDDPGNGTVPPLNRFVSTASPDVVRQGEVVTYELTIVNNEQTYVNVVLGLTSTVPIGVHVISDTVTASPGGARVTPDGNVTWEGRIERPGSILLSYQARVDRDMCGEKAIQAVLYEKENEGAGGPTDKQLERFASFVVGGCSLYLPHVSRPLSGIPVLLNWDFEAGPASGWGQYDNDKSSTLIYSTAKKPLPMPQGGSWFGWLGGMLNMRSELRQSIELPADHSGIELRFLSMIESAEECGPGDDRGIVLIDGIQIGEPFDLCKDKVTNTWQGITIPVPAVYLGKNVNLVLRSVTNSARNSNWLVDNVEFCSKDPRATQLGDCKKY